MVKSIFAPLQEWLLRRGQCGACGMPLKKGSVHQHRLGDLIKCKCGRQYFKKEDGMFRRAKQSELAE